MPSTTNRSTSSANAVEQTEVIPDGVFHAVPDVDPDAAATDDHVAVVMEISFWSNSDNDSGSNSDSEPVPAGLRHEVRVIDGGYCAVINGVAQSATFDSAEACFVAEADLHVVPPNTDVEITVNEGDLDAIVTSLRCSGDASVTIDETYYGEMQGADENGPAVWFPEDFDFFGMRRSRSRCTTSHPVRGVSPGHRRVG